MNSFEGAGEIAEVAASVSQHSGAPNEIVMESGVIFQVRKVPPLLMRRAMMQIKAPKVPVAYDEDRAREIENPTDPDYLQAVADYQEAQGMAAFGVMIIVGTSVKSIPEGMPHPADDTWLEALDAIELLQPEAERIRRASTPARYLAWVQYVAVLTTEDFIALRDGLGRMSGVSEADVAVAMDSFRSDAPGRTDNDVDVPASPQNGHSVPSFAGRVSAGD